TEMRGRLIPDKSQPHGIELVQGRELARGVPPFGRDGGEFGDFGRIDGRNGHASSSYQTENRITAAPLFVSAGVSLVSVWRMATLPGSADSQRLTSRTIASESAPLNILNFMPIFRFRAAL